MSTIWEAEDLVVGRVKSAWEGFVDFALRDNVLEVGVGLIIGTAFTGVVTSLVSDVLLPPISLLPFLNRTVEEKFFVLQAGPNYNDTIHGYNTLRQAVADGAVTLAYGFFLSQVIRLIMIALSLYLTAQLYSMVSHKNIITKTIKCRYCRKFISIQAKRCGFCTSWLDGREDSCP